MEKLAGFILPDTMSINKYYRNVKGKTLISSKGRYYQQAMHLIIKSHCLDLKIQSKVFLKIKWKLPDNYKRDIDNILKPLLDTLQKSKVILDDSQVHGLTVFKSKNISYLEKGEVLIEIYEYEENDLDKI